VKKYSVFKPIRYAGKFVGRILLYLLLGFIALGIVVSPKAANDSVLAWLSQQLGLVGFGLVGIGLLWARHIYLKPRDLQRCEAQLEQVNEELKTTNFPIELSVQRQKELQGDIEKYRSWTWKILNGLFAVALLIAGVGLIVKGFNAMPAQIDIYNEYPIVIVLCLQVWFALGRESLVKYAKSVSGILPLAAAFASLIIAQHLQLSPLGQAIFSATTFFAVAPLAREQTKP
jgi:hypothetical protein